MASNLFGRYVWLVDILRRHKRLTYEEINNYWQRSGLSYGEGDDLPKRTFHNHCNAIKDIFDIYIVCDIKDGYRYYIDEPERLEKDGFRNWLIDSYATLNQIHADRKLEGRIRFEDIPSGHKFLLPIIEAMRLNRIIHLTYKNFTAKIPHNFDIEPYFVRVYKRRWYLIARSPFYGDVRTYALDRIHSIEITEQKFTIPDDFSIDEYFDGCCGIFADKNIPIQKVVLKVYDYAQDFVETLPLDSSQKEIARNKKSTTYEYRVRPDFNFLQEILSQANMIEVLEPKSVRTQLKNIAQDLLHYYQK